MRTRKRRRRQLTAVAVVAVVVVVMATSFDAFLDRQITQQDYSALINYMHEIASQWREVGACLGIADGCLDSIDQSNWGVSRKLSATLRQWMSTMCTYPNWRNLLTALQLPLVNGHHVANKLIHALQIAYKTDNSLQYRDY